MASKNTGPQTDAPVASRKDPSSGEGAPEKQLSQSPPLKPLGHRHGSQPSRDVATSSHQYSYTPPPPSTIPAPSGAAGAMQKARRTRSRRMSVSGTRPSHLVGRLDLTHYASLPPVDFTRNPITLAALSADSHTTVPGRRSSLPATAPIARAASSSSSSRELYSDEEEVETSGSDSSSSSFFGRRVTCGCGVTSKNATGARRAPRQATSSSNVSDEEEWGPVPGGLCVRPGSSASSSSSSSFEGGMFIPEPVIRLDSAREKPPLPYLTKEQLVVGRTVWVVDEEDVETLLNTHFNRAYELVCNGRRAGTVMRHNGDMTMVTFLDPDTAVSCTLTMPRACLSLEPIEPYEGNAVRRCSNALGSYYCNVGPRVNGGRSAAEKKGNRCQQFYECVPAMSVPKDSLGELAEAQTLFQVGALAEALEIANRKLAKAEREAATLVEAQRASGAELWSLHESNRGARSPVSFLVDVLTLRSRVYVFLERYADALRDAERCVELEPGWVRGHLATARAHSALGNWAQATAAVRQAVTLLPTSSDLQRIRSLTQYLVEIQQRLEASGHEVRVTLDHLYRKRLHAARRHERREVLCAEVTPILAMTPMLAGHPAGRCSVCFRGGAEEMELVTSTRTHCASLVTPKPTRDDARATLAPTPVPESGATGGASPASNTSVGRSNDGSFAPMTAYYCSRGCQQRASLYTHMELKYRDGLERAKAMVRRGAVTSDDPMVPEVAAMTLRLFLMVVCTHRRLSAWRLRNLQQQHQQQASGGTSSQGSPLLDSSSQIDLSDQIVLCSPPPPPPPLPTDAALKLLGIFPLASDCLTDRGREQLAALHATLTADFREDARKVYPKELFFALFNYVQAYVTPVELPPPLYTPPASAAGVAGSAVDASAPTATTAFFLPWLVGCTQKVRLTVTAGTAESGVRPVAVPRLPSPSPTVRPPTAEHGHPSVDEGIPDSIGPACGFSLETLLASNERGEGRRGRDPAPTAEGAASPPIGGVQAHRASCRVHIAAANSKVQPVMQCNAETGLCSIELVPVADLPDGPLVELETVASVDEGEALSTVYGPSAV